MNRLVGLLLVLFVLAMALSIGFGIALETRAPTTTTSISTVTLTTSNTVEVVSIRTVTLSSFSTVEPVTITEEIIGVVTPQTALLKVIVSPASPNCTILLPTFVTPILGYNRTEFILPNGDLNSTISVVSTVTSFSQMPSAQTAYTTITESGNIEVNTTIVSGNSTTVTSTCPVYA